ncbi:MAG: Electron transport complex protein rnfC [Gammaproteobacteria bacterium]|nr:Electron transport complex protein rnfC [Gammaproteobacteria bacterium]
MIGATQGRTFRHGIHPEEHKEQTLGSLIQRMPFPAEVVLPLSQHLGASSKPVVKSGDKVYRGQLIAAADGFMSVPLHASVTGQVTAIEKRHHPSGKMVEAIIIASDLNSPQTLFNEGPIAWQHSSTKELLTAIQGGGFVGLGGAAFPTHVKFSVPDGKRVRFLLINGCECEPYLTTDHRIMLEYADAILLGIRIVQHLLGAEKTYLSVENNKWDAIRMLRERIPADLACEVIPLQTKYPQGAEKMLIAAVLHREVPSGRLPIDVQVMVSNVGTVAGIGDLFAYGQPLIERVVTVTGPGIKHPSTLLIPLGTRLSDILDYCGGISAATRQVIFGGPMMGSPQARLDVPILKGTSGIVCLTEVLATDRKEYACIRCSACLDACPVFLNPSQLGSLAKNGRYEDMLGLHIMDCIECGSCSIPLVQRFKVAKGLIRVKQQKKKAAA